MHVTPESNASLAAHWPRENAARANTTRRSWPRWWLALPVLLLAAWVGIRGLNADALWSDEYWSVEYAGGAHERDLTLAETWQRVVKNNHELNPPGYYLALNGWARIVGWSDTALRALSLFAGLLGIAWTYRAGRDIVSPLVGLLAALFVGASAFFVYYMHEARVYAFFPLCISMTLWAYWRIIHGRAEFGTKALFVLGVFGLLYTHYMAGLFAIAVAGYHLLFVCKDRAWWRVVWLMGLAGLFFLPWLTETLGALQNVSQNDGRDSVAMSFNEMAYLLAYGLSNGLIPLLVVIGIGGALSRGRAAGLVWFLLLVIVVTGFIANQFFFFTHIRYLMALVPLMALLFGLAGQWFYRHARLVLPLLVGVWLITGTVNGLGQPFHDTLFREIYRTVFRLHLPLDRATDAITAQVQDGDIVLLDAAVDPWALGGAFDYYMYPLGVRYALLNQIEEAETGATLAQKVDNFLDDALRVWVLVEDGPEQHDDLADLLSASSYTTCTQGTSFPGLQLALYSHVEGCCVSGDVPRDALIQYQNGISLLSLDADLAENGDSLSAVVGWALQSDVARESYSFGLHVQDTQHNLVVQSDNGVPDRAFQCLALNLDLTALEPGDYTLHLVVYHWQTSERITGTNTATGEQGDYLPLETFTIP